MKSPIERANQHFSAIYGKDLAEQWWHELKSRIEDFRSTHPDFSNVSEQSSAPLTEKDSFLITYSDQFSSTEELPLRVLNKFATKYLLGTFGGIHILPFYPSSSDDGFSIIDYREVNPAYGDWEDIEKIGQNFRLMFDAVINHVSRHSLWFQEFLRDEKPFSEYFIATDPLQDLSTVVRPRTHPLLTKVDTHNGDKYVWTTFSDDQIDLNYANPRVLLEVIDILLFYIHKGASVIRLDAIAYLWKKIGTSSIHLPKTHQIIKLLRAVVDTVAPGVALITETNVPHEENIRYFGDPILGTDDFDEAHMVYQFPLAALVLHSLLTGDARRLSTWVENVRAPSPTTTFFNFIASHDGIGLMPARGLLEDTEVEALIERTLQNGGQLSYKNLEDGSKVVYELNITLFDALTSPTQVDDGYALSRFLASQAVILVLAGVPGIYIHSLFGSRNCEECVRQTGRARSINREKFSYEQIELELAQGTSLRSRIFVEVLGLLKHRRMHPAFHPAGGQRILLLHDSVFSLVRTSPEGDEFLLSLINVSTDPVSLNIPLLNLDLPGDGAWEDILAAKRFEPEDVLLVIPLAPYQVRWLVHRPE